MERYKNTECTNRRYFGNLNGKCEILNNTTFTKACPFFKTEEQVNAERERSKQRRKKFSVV